MGGWIFLPFFLYFPKILQFIFQNFGDKIFFCKTLKTNTFLFIDIQNKPFILPKSFIKYIENLCDKPFC